MNRYHFLARNLRDKIAKSLGDWDTFKFYLQTYVLSAFERVEPDIYIVSYPKCGRTWLRVLLINYLKLRGVTVERFRDNSVLGIAGRIVKFEHDQGNWAPAPPVLKRLRFNAAKYSGKRIVFLVRDPRDVLVSSWYHQKYRDRVYMRDLSHFVRDDLVGIRKIVAFMNMWVENSHVPDRYMLLGYEQMHEDAAVSFKDFLEFCEIDLDTETIRQAVEMSSFESMKKMELKGSLREPWMKAGSKGVERSMKIREGKTGGFKRELSESDLDFVNCIIERELTPTLSYGQARGNDP